MESKLEFELMQAGIRGLRAMETQLNNINYFMRSNNRNIRKKEQDKYA